MPFVKLDTGILHSTLWVDLPCREIFLTALLMAEPREVMSPLEQIEVRTLNKTGFIVPVGWYGFVSAAGTGIVRQSLIDHEVGMSALERLGSADPQSRSNEFDGRRLIRVDGGFIVLNYMKYRERDYTAAERQKRWRDKKKQNGVTSDDITETRYITQAEVEAEDIKEQNPPLPLTLVGPAVNGFQISKFFDYFKQQTGKTNAYTLTPVRQRMGEKRWKEALVITHGDVIAAETLFTNAINALAKSEWHRKERQMDWDLIFRSAENFTKWIEKTTRANPFNPPGYESQSVIRRRELEERKARGL